MAKSTVYGPKENILLYNTFFNVNPGKREAILRYEASSNATTYTLTLNGGQRLTTIYPGYKYVIEKWTYTITGTGQTSKKVTVTSTPEKNVRIGDKEYTEIKDFKWTWNKTHAQQTITITAYLNSSYKITRKFTIPAKTSSQLKYDANGGTGAPGPQTKWTGENLKLQPGKPTRTGYIFKGWATSKTGAAVYQPGGTYSTEIGNKGATLYAVWEIIKYTITYNANGGSDAPGNQTKNYGDNNFKLQPGEPTRTGYSFKGWATSSTGAVAYQPNEFYTGNANLDLFAVWEIIKYTITYNANGGSGAPENQIKNYGDTINLSSTIPTRTGYNFQGWATSETGPVAYSPNQPYSNNANLNLFAIWGEKTYTITYDANGGTEAPENQIKYYDIDLKLSSIIPIRRGYSFKGWATNKTGPAVYQPDQSYSDNANLNLYAVWSLTNKVTMYNENGEPLSGQVHIYNEDGELKKCVIYIYDSDGNRKGTG